MSKEFVLFLFFLPGVAFQLFGERKDFALLIGSNLPAFLAYFRIVFSKEIEDRFSSFTKTVAKIRILLPEISSSEFSFRTWIFLGFVLRIGMFFSEPILSEDVDRFLWDGLLVHEGISPFSILPKELDLSVFNGSARILVAQLLNEMNSAKFYSVYPPLLQFLFYLSAKGMLWFQNVSVGIAIWKSILIFSEIGVLLLLCKILKENDLPIRRSLIYWLNPLVILEIAGNAHPEPVLLFFLVGAVYSLWKWTKYQKTKDFFFHVVFVVLGILTKITPLILLPWTVFTLFGRKKFLLLLQTSLFATVFALVGLFFFREEFFEKQNESGLGVFFQLFEFNGGFYYLLREFLRTIGANFYLAGKICGWAALFLILAFSYQRKKETDLGDFFASAETIYLFFFLFSTTVHPWYILPLLVFSVFSGRIFSIVWSALILLSYSTYETFPYRDSFWWIGVEYGILFFFLHIDYKLISSLNPSTRSSSTT
ncbi:dolichyl-phosphate-mannose--protein mannosyltransferase [Leptospira sp. 201903071]|uniref:dolichyl-phosphate-mannose--protein mannosyltransferase n=1 Tax=Leptospira ainazelensis TaxID=2810034 RepID=UPI001964C70E|nr:dolichyl-phosphate-mannose--protein mannosyltransferase [Leptospira ainazelensis]MBM9501264.1 dolichyl-phosphate-mannose--protein mannosyltransferase [Leptospira ainazelensis]